MPSEPQKGGPPVESGHHRILVVEDDPDMAEALRLILEGEGFDVILAPGPDEAVASFQEHPPDLILLDVMMPSGTEGFHFVWRLREHTDPHLRDLPILILTGLHQTTALRVAHDLEDADYAAGEFLPVQGFLEKPVEPDHLLQEIRRVLGMPALEGPDREGP